MRTTSSIHNNMEVVTSTRPCSSTHQTVWNNIHCIMKLIGIQDIALGCILQFAHHRYYPGDRHKSYLVGISKIRTPVTLSRLLGGMIRLHQSGKLHQGWKVSIKLGWDFQTAITPDKACPQRFYATPKLKILPERSQEFM